jgi:hypothetical protein
MELPPAEERQAALTAMGIQDPFCSELRPQQLQQMLEMEVAATESIFVVMSDIQLDRPVVSPSVSVLLLGSESLTQCFNELPVKSRVMHLNNGNLLLLLALGPGEAATRVRRFRRSRVESALHPDGHIRLQARSIASGEGSCDRLFLSPC